MERGSSGARASGIARVTQCRKWRCFGCSLSLSDVFFVPLGFYVLPKRVCFSWLSSSFWNNSWLASTPSTPGLRCGWYFSCQDNIWLPLSSSVSNPGPVICTQVSKVAFSSHVWYESQQVKQGKEFGLFCPKVTCSCGRARFLLEASCPHLPLSPHREIDLSHLRRTLQSGNLRG